jgi:hypothetical protein
VLWRGNACCRRIAAKVDACRSRGGVNHCQFIMQTEVAMKVVLIDNPRFISGILRKMFGIKKIKQI